MQENENTVILSFIWEQFIVPKIVYSFQNEYDIEELPIVCKKRCLSITFRRNTVLSSEWSTVISVKEVLVYCFLNEYNFVFWTNYTMLDKCLSVDVRMIIILSSQGPI